MKYPFIIEPASGNLAASAVQFPGVTTAEDRTELERLMAELLAINLQGVAERGETAPEPLRPEDIDLSGYEEGSEIVYIEAAPLDSF